MHKRSLEEGNSSKSTRKRVRIAQQQQQEEATDASIAEAIYNALEPVVSKQRGGRLKVVVDGYDSDDSDLGLEESKSGNNQDDDDDMFAGTKERKKPPIVEGEEAFVSHSDDATDDVVPIEPFNMSTEMAEGYKSEYLKSYFE